MENDAEAIMNYARTKKLFEEHDNIKGFGICSYHIGLISMKNKNWD